MKKKTYQRTEQFGTTSTTDPKQYNNNKFQNIQ